MKAAELIASRYPFVNHLLTNRLVEVMMAAAAIVFATQAALFAVTIATAEDYVTIYGPVIGGDFVVFDRAADAALSGDPAAIYDSKVLAQELAEAFPTHGDFRLSWQYPPSIYLLIWPLAFLSYLSSYALWAFATGGLFLLSLRNIWTDRAALFLVIASPAAFQSLITGQTGFLTAALLVGAAMWADRRPLIAGIAAGLLTVKPQLGLLIPFAFAAAGCWRAFAVAAATAALMIGASVALFGTESWSAFFDAVTTHGARLQLDIFPYYKLISVFGGAATLGASPAAALAAQAVASLTLAAVIAIVWRKIADPDLRAAALIAAAPLATPYAFYYEAALLIAPVLIVARRGVCGGWLKGERPAIALLWLAPLAMPGPKDIPGAPYSFLVAAGVLAFVLRRVFAALRAERPSGAPA